MTEPDSGTSPDGSLPGDPEDTPPDLILSAPPVSGSTRAERGSMRRSQWSPAPPPAAGPGSAGRETATKPPLLLGLAVLLVIAAAVIVVVRSEGGGPPTKAVTSSSASAHPTSGTGILQPVGSTPGGKGNPATKRPSAPDAEYPQRLEKTSAVAILAIQAASIP